MSDYREEIGDFLYLLSEKLDEELYEDFLSLCDADFHYQVSAFSPELGKEMVWLDHDYKEIRNLMLLIHQHVRMKGNFTRNISMVRIRTAGENCYEVRSQIMVMHTDQYGTTKLFAIGNYTDKVTRKQDQLRLLERKVYLNTRDLGSGIHVPI
ncbi:aromatic-ring-hydroxylating dioxygenase subunit beta [Bordetella bronchiseptica]|uniref:aromatic-ring-hydroxylating dioxygenase subunit beta n=1 Tax=Bordetella bronchiseptica TaxID=518 RepID=UPI000461B163|nr:aromatic-ring-hydroxylating dioxygenase subunit beta [Bordetella bronchiseptica]KDC47021.1 ring hydroxylating beta subunit [Bordetella bronchiseptica M85/00/2]